MKKFIIKHKKNIGYILLFLIISIITFLFSYFVFPLHTWDEVWNYGFSYNISKGMVIYRDFNVLQTPLSFFCGSLFIKIFGSYLYSIHIMYAILISIIMLIVFDIIRWKSFIVYPFILWQITPSYNLFSLFLLFVIIYFIYKKKDSDLLIGIVMGVLLLTKQNLGICLLIPAFFYSKKKIKFLIAFLIPILICSIYLIYNNAIYEFIDYCFLGMFDFNESNKSFSFFLILEFFILLYLICKFAKDKFKNKVLFYILLFQFMCYPICDANHFFIALVPVLFYVLCIIKKMNKYIFIISIFTIYFIFLFLCFQNKIHLNKSDNFMYLRNDTLISYYNDLVMQFSNYKVNCDYKFYIFYYAYYIKLIDDEKINKYDFLLNGNMGYNGNKKYTEEIGYICKNNKCIFLVDNKFVKTDDNYQFALDILNYVINNYNKIDSNEYFDVYSS